MEEPERQTPGIAITLYVVAVISLFAGFIFFIIAATQDNSAAAQSDIVAAVGAIIGGLLFIAVAYGLTKLCEIEAHLRFRPNANGAKAFASLPEPAAADLVPKSTQPDVPAVSPATVPPKQLPTVNTETARLDEEADRNWVNRPKQVNFTRLALLLVFMFLALAAIGYSLFYRSAPTQATRDDASQGRDKKPYRPIDAEGNRPPY
jgi:hypothetical protein